MHSAEADPRIFFAAERTLLAWLRTGITIMALGFVVARFGLFMQLVAHQTSTVHLKYSESFAGILGVAFVVIGALSILISTRQHQRFISGLAECELPKSYSGAPVLLVSFGIAVCGFILALYLTLSG